ncbi:hypothetical protein ElyMa_003582000 [Elysia marginata]|uniref:Uncharacterized protein n=1 Tax=Elysia marginata TaxID=1093978 RepID=A0AAV4EP20_9GAST|nr:hypothetical protein ElyMa_003582000 [Elysia marginata]
MGLIIATFLTFQYTSYNDDDFEDNDYADDDDGDVDDDDCDVDDDDDAQPGKGLCGDFQSSRAEVQMTKQKGKAEVRKVGKQSHLEGDKTSKQNRLSRSGCGLMVHSLRSSSMTVRLSLDRFLYTS